MIDQPGASFSDVAFIECAPSGHRAKYVELLVGLTDAKFLISAELFAALEPSLQDTLKSEDRVHIVPSSMRKPFLAEVLSFLRRGEWELSCICVLMLDDFLSQCPQAILSFLVKAPVPLKAGLVIDSTFCYPSWHKAKTVVRMLARLAMYAYVRVRCPNIRIFALDANLPKLLARIGYRSDRMQAVPDPALIADYAGEDPEPQPGRVLLFGRHTKRKGTAWAIPLLAMNELVREIRVVGETVDRAAINRAVTAAREHTAVSVIDRQVSDQEAATEFQQAQIVCAPYEDFASSSNVVLNAWHFGRQVVFPNYGFMASLLKKYKGGYLYKEGGKAAFQEAVTSALQGGSREASRQLKQTVAAAHAKGAFVEALLEGFQRDAKMAAHERAVG